NGRIHLSNFSFANQVSNRRGPHHDFVSRHPARPVFGLKQGLRDDRSQRFGEHGANHFLFGRGEHVDDTVDGFGGRGGVQGSKHQVSRLGGGQGKANGLQVAHLAHQHHVGIFAQRGFQSVGKRER